MADAITNKVAVFVEPTPNPNSLKFILAKEIAPAASSYEFATVEEAAESPLAARLFEIAGVEGVFIGSNFVTVRKLTEFDWDAIEPRAIETIEELASSGVPLVKIEEPGDADSGDMDADEATIRRILKDEIRPAVAMDGGDVLFDKYDAGILTLKLVGACSGCPSSLMTLRMGIERRLREDVPDLKEVVQVAN